MGCSNARLLVQTSLSEPNAITNLNTNNPLNPLPTSVTTSNETSPIGIVTDTNNITTRMHLTGVDLVVERNGSYTLLLTPKTHKQLMPYVLRKKRFRILVDKSRSQETSTVNVPLSSYYLTNKERIMENDKELKLNEKKSKKQINDNMETTIENVQQVATNELDKAKARFIGGRSIDRGDPENENIQSDDEGMIEEIVTTVEEDKDLECKVKKKIETKKTIAEDPETHNKITKVVKTEVTEITRTITINDQHDLERAKRELGIDDVSKLLSSTQIRYNTPTSSSWIDQPRLIHVQEKYYEPSNEIVTSGDFPSDSPIKQHSPTINHNEQESKQDQTLADATTVGRGPVIETLSSSSSQPISSQQQQRPTTTNDKSKQIEVKQKKKKSSLNLCSCARNTTNDHDEEQRKQKAATIVEQKSKQKKKASSTTTQPILTSTNIENESQNQGQKLISDDIKKLIKDKKSLLINYIHLKIFLPSKLFTTNEQDLKGRKISSRILDLLQHDRCSSWNNLFEQLKNEYSEQLSPNLFIQPMVKTYEDLFTTKQSNLLNTFSTIHNEKDIKNSSENSDYITIVQTHINERDHQPNISVITKPIEDTLQRLQHHGQSDEKVIDDDHEKKQPALVHTKDVEMSDNIKKNLRVYNEEQLIKMLADISPHKPITLAEAIAYGYIDLDDPKLGLSNDTIQRMKNLFRPLLYDDESTLNLIRIKRSGQYLTDFNLSETNPFEKFHLSQPFIYQLQQSFEPTLDLNEKQFRSLTEAILNNKDEYSNLQFDIGRSLIPADDMKESSTNDFSQSDSGYSMTTATYESLASKIKNEFEPINEPITDQLNESNKTKSPIDYEKSIIPENTELQSTTIEQKPIVHLEPRSPIIEPINLQSEIIDEKPIVNLDAQQPKIESINVQPEIVKHKTITHLEARSPTIEPIDVQYEKTSIVVPLTRKTDESTSSKPTINLHGAAVDLPEIELVKPGPLPTLPITKEKHKKPKELGTTDKTPKVKKSTGGLCASCFGTKAAENKKKELTSKTLQAPIEQKKIIGQEKKDNIPSTTIISSAPTIESVPVPVLPTKTTTTTTTDEQVILPSVEIDKVEEQTTGDLPKLEDRLDATIEKLIITEEPHYQLPSSEPVPLPEYSIPEPNTYDTPRSLETPTIETTQTNTEEKILTSEISPEISTLEIKKPVDEIMPPIEQKIESIITTKSETMPNVEINESTKKGSYTLPTKKSKTKKSKQPKVKTEKKPSLFSTLFRHSDHKSKAPTLNLPSVEQDLTRTKETHTNTKVPLHAPNIDLPKLDISLPNYDRPEVDMTSGQIKQSSEFSIPAVDLPPIPNLNLPDTNKSTSDTTIDPLKVPNIQLPELQLTSNEQENVKLPEIHLKSEKEKLPNVSSTIDIKDDNKIENLPTITDGLALASPVNDMLAIQTDKKNFPIETDSPIPDLPKIPSNETEIPIKPELLSTEQKYTTTETHFVQPPELPTIINKQTTENYEIPPKLPDFTFQMPSTEPISTLSRDISVSPPSFENELPTDTSRIVPAVEISTSPIKSTEKQIIEPKVEIKKKSSTPALCSCFGNKSQTQKEKTKTIAAPKANLPEVNIPSPSSNVSSTLKTKGSLRAPSNDLPAVDLTLPQTESVRLPTTHTTEKKRQAPTKPIVNEEIVLSRPIVTSSEVVLPTTTTPTIDDVHLQQTDTIRSIEVKADEDLLVKPLTLEKQIDGQSSITVPSVVNEKQLDEQINIRSPTVIETPLKEEVKIESITTTTPIEKQSVEEIKDKQIESKKVSSFEIKAPALHIPDLDLAAPSKTDAYISSIKQEQTTTQSRSDSGLEAIISSHIHPSSTFGTIQTIEDLNQHPSLSSGLGSEIIDSVTTKDITLSDIQQQNLTTESKIDNSLLKHDFTRKITMNDDLRAKLIFRQNELKKCLETEISKSIDDFDTKKDQKSLNKILTHAIDLIKDKKVTTYPELKQKLIVEHKNDAFIVDPVVRSLYFTIENQGLDNLDKPEFPLAIRDMVRLPAKQTYETVTHINKDVKKEPTHTSQEQPTNRSCLTCGRSKSKQKTSSTIPKPTTTITHTGLLDERRRGQLNTHRNELGDILRAHIQSSQPSIRQFPEHPKEIDKIVRKSLILLNQPKILSYEQIRNDLKTEYKQTFYLVDPIVDITRDTLDHCDITQMKEKINLDILDSNITQTANLYNQIYNQSNLLSTAEYNLLKSNQLQWLNQYLIDNELKMKKLTRKQTKELHKILNRTLDLLSLNLIYTWDELNAQLRREFPKAHDLCDRSIELIKQTQKDGLLLLQQSPNTNQQDLTSINVISANGKRRASSLLTERAKQNIQTNRKKIISSITNLLYDYNKPLYNENQIETYVNKTFHYLEEKKIGEFKTYNDLKDRLKKDFKHNHEKLIEQIVDIIEQAHATNQFDDIDKPEVQTLMKDRLDGKPLVIKEMYVSLPPRTGTYGTSKYTNDESSRYLSTSINGDQTMNSSTSSHRVARGLSWREANERARILFYRGKHPAIHYDEQAAGFDVRMLLETTSGGTQEIPVTDSDVHELLNSCGVQWDGVNIISLVDHSEDVVRAAEQAALKVIREKGLVDLRTPPPTRNTDDNDEPLSS
ncbi:unnamed protein product [Rotaria sordida]|uniref:Uncharacterized protein n=2 Tax=Rotaria sordida TaxID=392033 RepID=A0A814B310_9BILA|nr:unnamed protein product [Rotaria sordida]